MIAAVVMASGCGGDDAVEEGAGDVPAPRDRVPMIVDYSPTLSDVPALMVLATHTGVDLLAVTLAGTGESDCEPGVRNTRALLVIAGHPEVPVACGPEAPMQGDRDWPLRFREAAATLGGVLLPGVGTADPIDAVELLSDTLREADRPVTVVTLGPLTNLGAALEADPTLATSVRSVVTMGGAFDVPGNVDDSPDAEWNVYIDPESVRVVLDSGVPVTFVPLDATNFVPGNVGILARLTASVATDAGEAVRQLWAASLGTERSIAAPWWYFWDELAAVVALDPSVATLSERSVTVEDSGATVEAADGVTAVVASAADPERFEQIFLETFAGGAIPAMELTGAEERYVATVRSGLHDLTSAIDGAFAGVEQQAQPTAADELAARLVGEVFDAMADFHEEVAGLESAGRLGAQHDALLRSVHTFLDTQPRFLRALATAPPQETMGVDEFFEYFFEATERAGLTAPFEEFETACGDLELAAYGLGATEGLCSP